MKDTYRDTCSDYVDFSVLADSSPGSPNPVKSAIEGFLARSGANNVTSAVVRRWQDIADLRIRYAVSFDSAAWTGRYAPLEKRQDKA